MARTVHTQPKRIRAPRRLRAPRAPRGEGDLATQRSLARTLKSWGIVLEPAGASSEREEAPLPRIRVKRPRRGHGHSLRKPDIAAALRFFGESCTYGLREIELSSGPAAGGLELELGRLIVPGRIVVHAQPESPWRLRGRLAAKHRRRLEGAGALVETEDDGLSTVVVWPGDTLRDFVLFDVLMHEIGHHIIQHYRGKRRVRSARTKDHEAFASHFARRCRLLWEKARLSGDE